MGKNKKELGHIEYKISAVLLAIVAWLAVANISDYQTTRQISKYSGHSDQWRCA